MRHTIFASLAITLLWVPACGEPAEPGATSTEYIILLAPTDALPVAADVAFTLAPAQGAAEPGEVLGQLTVVEGDELEITVMITGAEHELALIDDGEERSIWWGDDALEPDHDMSGFDGVQRLALRVADRAIADLAGDDAFRCWPKAWKVPE